MLLKVEGGCEVRHRNPSGPLRLRQPDLNGPASLQWPAATCNILFGDAAGVVHLRHLLNHGCEGQAILYVFNINLRSLTQVPDPNGDEGLALRGVVQWDLVVKPERTPIRRPLVLISSHQVRNHLPVCKVIATDWASASPSVPSVGITVIIFVSGHHDDYLRLIIHPVNEGEVFGRRLETACLRQLDVQVEASNRVGYVVQPKSLHEHGVQWKMKPRSK
jgi:hypothetical protein